MSSETTSGATKPATRSGRPPEIDREAIVSAALSLLGPYRSVATLSLREVARAAGIAPNSFYRHFRNIDELSVALIDEAGRSLRSIVGAARQRVSPGQSAIRTSVEAFFDQLNASDSLLHLLLREGTVGSDEFKQAVERQLCSFEDELRSDLVRLASQYGHQIYAPELAARALTRLVFAMGARALDGPREQHAHMIEELIVMLRMIVVGTQAMAATPQALDS